MKKYFAVFLFASVQLLAQITTRPTDPLVKDPFFSQQQAQQKQGEKVKLVHADFVKKDPAKFNGNTFFEGNVQFDHQGSVVTSDFVIWYEKENFVKAVGNVKLRNADGSVITAQEMEYDGNTQRGIAKKDVVLTDPKQTIRTETLYYDRISNKAYFNTGGTITDGQGIMYAKSATYNIATKLIDFTGNVKIENNQYIVDGTNIVQNQNTNVATFNGPTTIINRDNPSNRVYTESGTYNQNTKEVWLNKNSTIYYNNKTLVGDKMYYNQITGFGTATGNVTLNDPQERRYIKGGYGEIYEKIDSAMVTEKAYAVKILENDSIYFSANRILAYQKMDSTNIKKSFLRAYRQARFFKSNIQSRSDSLSFNETDGVLHLAGSPIAWSGAKQVSGDKIEAYFDTENEYIDSLKVIGNAFAISKADSLNLKDEFNQVKGKLMTVYYKENEVNLANVIGNAQAVTYADDENEKTRETERIGVALSTCGIIEALFEERRVQIISCNIGALTDIYPMSKISKEMRFLQGFNWNTKDRLLKWQDIFVDTPNYEEVQYTEDNPLFDAAQAEIDRARAAEEAKKPKRVRR
ncbi:OstA-like protein [Kaistella sp. PBT33-4]|uniref:OstA-like protein n=1 Tax=Kaistella sp. PBT33-4 TaxID=3032000 RepID=UPI0023D84CBD|nr:OstA-like protein [Kaistella sp. PBT33-4]MDF0718723.1 OstA-like protein [Kaistella sp. PBT33-4]